MDWFQILLIVIFLVFPFLRQILGKAQQAPPVDEPDDFPPVESGETVQTRERAPARSGSPAGGSARGSSDSSDTWSSDWGTWPGATPEETVPEGVVSAPPPRPMPSAPELEDVTSIWDSVPAAPSGTAQERLRRITAGAEAVPLRRTSAIKQLERQAGRVTRTRLPLNNPRELRQAIILTEVLGPPLALREPAGLS
jgi:hypothetical protein